MLYICIYIIILSLLYISLHFLIGIHSFTLRKAEEPLPGMELQQKEEKDQNHREKLIRKTQI